jgi:hypothetical protein
MYKERIYLKTYQISICARYCSGLIVVCYFLLLHHARALTNSAPYFEVLRAEHAFGLFYPANEAFSYIQDSATDPTPNRIVRLWMRKDGLGEGEALESTRALLEGRETEWTRWVMTPTQWRKTYQYFSTNTIWNIASTNQLDEEDVDFLLNFYQSGNVKEWNGSFTTISGLVAYCDSIIPTPEDSMPAGTLRACHYKFDIKGEFYSFTNWVDTNILYKIVADKSENSEFRVRVLCLYLKTATSVDVKDALLQYLLREGKMDVKERISIYERVTEIWLESKKDKKAAIFSALLNAASQETSQSAFDTCDQQLLSMDKAYGISAQRLTMLTRQLSMPFSEEDQYLKKQMEKAVETIKLNSKVKAPTKWK